MSNSLLCFTNCQLVTEHGTLERRDLWIDEESGLIVDAQKAFYQSRIRPTKMFDLEGNILSPGFIDIQINGAYDFDFSVYNGDDESYRKGCDTVSERIVETGVTSLVPTIITQEKSLYPPLLALLTPDPNHRRNGANLLGWHAEGPFIQLSKRGAHDPSYIITSPSNITSFSSIYGPTALAPSTPSSSPSSSPFVRIITLAPELPSLLSSSLISHLTQLGITISIGHSIANSEEAIEAIKQGARCITHLFNAMPVLHHRDPGIVGLLGLSPSLGIGGWEGGEKVKVRDRAGGDVGRGREEGGRGGHLVGRDKVFAEALPEVVTPPESPTPKEKEKITRTNSLSDLMNAKILGKNISFSSSSSPSADLERPFYEMIVDGVHSHPNSVRLAYSSHKEGCILITDAMAITNPNLPDGSYPWRDGRHYIKKGVKLYLEKPASEGGGETLAGSVVTMDTCIRNFDKFTGCGIAEAIKCATINPARCLKIENRKGTLRPGADADLVILGYDEGTGERGGKGKGEWRVMSTWVAGKKVWKRD